jgi:hypothetical protein
MIVGMRRLSFRLARYSRQRKAATLGALRVISKQQLSLRFMLYLSGKAVPCLNRRKRRQRSAAIAAAGRKILQSNCRDDRNK